MGVLPPTRLQLLVRRWGLAPEARRHCGDFFHESPISCGVDACVEGEADYSLEDPTYIGLAAKMWLRQRTTQNQISQSLLVSFRST